MSQPQEFQNLEKYGNVQWVHTNEQGEVVLDKYLPAYEVGTTPYGYRFVVVSALPHELIFEDGTRLPPGDLEFCNFIKADTSEVERYKPYRGALYDEESSEETTKPSGDLQFVHQTFHMSPNLITQMKFWMYHVQNFDPLFAEDKKVALAVVTSIIGIQGGFSLVGTGPTFVAPITTPETCRLPNQQKRCYKKQWAV